MIAAVRMPVQLMNTASASGVSTRDIHDVPRLRRLDGFDIATEIQPTMAVTVKPAASRYSLAVDVRREHRDGLGAQRSQGAAVEVVVAGTPAAFRICSMMAASPLGPSTSCPTYTHTPRPAPRARPDCAAPNGFHESQRDVLLRPRIGFDGLNV